MSYIKIPANSEANAPTILLDVNTNEEMEHAAIILKDIGEAFAYIWDEAGGIEWSTGEMILAE